MFLQMEKEPRPSNYYQYRALRWKRASTLQKELTQAIEEDYRVVAISRSVARSKTGSKWVILEKPAVKPVQRLSNADGTTPSSTALPE